MKRHHTRRQVSAATAIVANVLIAASLNMAIAPGFDANARPPKAESGRSPSESAGMAPALRGRVPPSDVARELEDEVLAGRNAVLRANGKKGTFYVFSDPSCGYCRRLESELDKLGRDYTIHLFPVSVVGENTYERVRKLMCARADTRPALWRDAIQGRLPSNPGCSDGDAAIEMNDRNFFRFGFTGTPTIISENGDRMPDSYESAAAISRWLKQQAARH